MSYEKNEIKEINEALRLLKSEIRQTTELIQLLREFMHEDHVLILY